MKEEGELQEQGRLTVIDGNETVRERGVKELSMLAGGLSKDKKGESCRRRVKKGEAIHISCRDLRNGRDYSRPGGGRILTKATKE